MISQGLTQAVHRAIQAVLEIDKGVGSPELAAKFFAGDHVSGPPQQDFKNLQGLSLQPKLGSPLTQFAGAGIEFEDTKTQDTRGWSRVRHIVFRQCGLRLSQNVAIH